MAAPKVETERGGLHTCLWKAGLGLSRYKWKLDLSGMHTHYRQRSAKWEESMYVCVCVCNLCVCTMTLFPISPSENTIFLWEQWVRGRDSGQEWYSKMVPYLKNRWIGTNNRFLSHGTRPVLFIQFSHTQGITWNLFPASNPDLRKGSIKRFGH